MNGQDRPQLNFQHEIGAPGSRQTLFAVVSRDPDRSGDHSRLSDRTVRSFQVDVLLASNPLNSQRINVGFSKGDGETLLVAPLVGVEFETNNGKFTIHNNKDDRLSSISMEVISESADEARRYVLDAVSPVLDHMSYAGSVPLHVVRVRVQDATNEVTVATLTVPDGPVNVQSALVVLHAEMSPIYALYREYKNSSSPYYRLLCLYKILEGIFGVLRPNARAEAVRLGVTPNMPKEKVPDHPDINSGLANLVGKPIREFYDRTLQKEYRDVVSHFLVQGGLVLHASSTYDQDRFSDMAFLTDLCCKVVIGNHESVCEQLRVARASQQEPS